MGRLGVTAIVAGITLAGCSNQYPADRVTKVADDDPRMNAAMGKARSTVSSFLAALQSPQPGQSGFTVKTAFSDGSNTEHIWLGPVSYDGETIHGTVRNAPTTVKSVKMGQYAAVPPSRISDWMYLDHGKVVGGHTLRVLRETLLPRERADFDKKVQFLTVRRTRTSTACEAACGRSVDAKVSGIILWRAGSVAAPGQEDSHGRRASRSSPAGPATSRITPCPTSTSKT